MDHSSITYKKKKREGGGTLKNYSYGTFVWCVGVFETDVLLSALSSSDLQNLLQIQLPAEQSDSCDEQRALTAL